MGRHLHHPRRSRRVMLPDRKLLPAELSCNAACRGLSARPLHPFGSSSENNAYGTASPTPAPESARQPPAGKIISKFDFHRRRQGAFRSPLHPFGSFLPKQIDNPVGRQDPIRDVVGASAPGRKNFQQIWLSPIQSGIFPRGKPSARPELPCTLAAAPEHFPLQKTNAPQDSNFPSTP